MKNNLPKQYIPKDREDKIYAKWEKSGYFNPDNLDLPEDAPTYTIVLPPPNITAKLHLGHSSMLAIEDLLIRFHRMRGFRTLWIPGTDHAAIATQNAVEKKILAETGKTRHDLGKEKFLKEVWQFIENTQAIILNQTRKMGATLDWSRQAFTLDAPRQKAVAKMFKDMYQEGAIYRGERIVNWCPRCKSTLADDEVEYKEQKAILYTFKYSRDFPFEIATTRPETKLGDTAVAVNPDNPEHKEYIGQEHDVNFCGIGLRLKIIADENVDPSFGTGALGVTPAHSMIDWEIAKKNNLKMVKVIDTDGNIQLHDPQDLSGKEEYQILENCYRSSAGKREFEGLSAKKARQKIIKKLKEQNLITKEEEINNNLSICYRCDTPIEPLPSLQWFVAVDKKIKRLGNKSLKERAIEVAKKEEIKFTPHRFKKRYLDWMNNLHDWCVSRQIWFGHRIPVWHKSHNAQHITDNNNIYVGITPPAGDDWIQAPDTLDTWFSSGTWTFSTLGWPDNFQNNEKTGDLAKFHPTQVLETGYEIITLWVSRMIMMSLFALDEIPFENVCLHGMVLDKYGKKMSKSRGNGIDPLDMIEKFGADAVRLSLLIGNTPGNDLKLGEEKIESCRNFANKLWNIARYILNNDQWSMNNDQLNDEELNNLTQADKWILDKLNKLINQVTDDIQNYQFSQAGIALKEFSWNDLADWYLEASKFENNPEKSQILTHILKALLKLIHPFMPFITEAIWQEMAEEKLLMVEKWPTPMNNVQWSMVNFELIQKIIIAIRNARSENKVEPSKKIKAVIYAGEKKNSILSQGHLIKNLKTSIEELTVEKKGAKIDKAIYLTCENIEIYLIGAVDPAAEKARIEKEIKNLKDYIESLEKKLANKNFQDKAPAQVVEKIKNQLKQSQIELERLKKA